MLAKMKRTTYERMYRKSSIKPNLVLRALFPGFGKAP